MNTRFFSSKTIVLTLIRSFTLLLAGHLIVAAAYFSTLTQIQFGKHLPLDLFFFEFEKNLPAFFSSLLLVLAGILLHHLFTILKADNKAGARYSKVLSYIFFFLAADEWFSLHENLNVIQFDALGFPSWVVFYLPATALLGFFGIQFLRTLPFSTLRLFVLSGCLYVGGSALFEIASSTLSSVQFNDLAYQIILVCEDGLEMVGILLFIYALCGYIKHLTHKDLIPLPIKTLGIISGLAVIEMGITLFVNQS